MNRRQILSLAQGAAGAGLLLATTRPGFAQPGPVPDKPNPYKQSTLQIGSLSLQTSQLALQHAKNPKIQEFANFELAEQRAMAEVLTDQRNPPPVALDSDNAAILKRLQNTPAAQFDAAYLTAQIQAHGQLLNVQQEFLQTQSGITSDEAHIAILATSVIRMHLAMLSDLKGTLKVPDAQ